MFVRFIPASDIHFQAFLLEGLSRWNQARALAAVQHYQNIQSWSGLQGVYISMDLSDIHLLG